MANNLFGSTKNRVARLQKAAFPARRRAATLAEAAFFEQLTAEEIAEFASDLDKFYRAGGGKIADDWWNTFTAAERAGFTTGGMIDMDKLAAVDKARKAEAERGK